jgi:uncharacterized protein
VIFIDSNVPMYLVGAAHPNKDATLRWLDHVIRSGERLVTDAEVLQEVLHRYGAIRRFDALEPATNTLLQLVDEVFPITRANVIAARDLLVRGGGRHTARDAIHIAVMRANGIHRIFTFDRDFDGLPDIAREPQ